MYLKLLPVLGLAFDIIGVVILYYAFNSSDLKKAFSSVGFRDAGAGAKKYSEKFAKKHDKRAIIGLSFLITGFLLQMVPYVWYLIVDS